MPSIFCWPLVEVKRKILFHFKREHIFLDFLDFPIFVLDVHTNVPFSHLWGFLLPSSDDTRTMLFQIPKVIISFLLESQQHCYLTATFLIFPLLFASSYQSCVIGVQVRKTHLFHHLYILILVFVIFASFTFIYSWIKSSLIRLVPRTLHESALRNLFLGFPSPLHFSASNENSYRMSKQSKGSMKRKIP